MIIGSSFLMGQRWVGDSEELAEELCRQRLRWFGVCAPGEQVELKQLWGLHFQRSEAWRVVEREGSMEGGTRDRVAKGEAKENP